MKHAVGHVRRQNQKTAATVISAVLPRQFNHVKLQEFSSSALLTFILGFSSRPDLLKGAIILLLNGYGRTVPRGRTAETCSCPLPFTDEVQHILPHPLITPLKPTTQKTFCISATTTNRLMLLREIIAVHCANHMEHTHIRCVGKILSLFYC